MNDALICPSSMLSECIVPCSEGTSPFERVTHLHSLECTFPPARVGLPPSYTSGLCTRASRAYAPVQVGLMHPCKSGLCTRASRAAVRTGVTDFYASAAAPGFSERKTGINHFSTTKGYHPLETPVFLAREPV